jgi:catalase
MFPDFIHSEKPDPFTNRQEPDNVWDFFSHSPEATHQFTWLFGDRGQQRLVDNIAGSLAQVSREDIIERPVGHFTKADAEFGRRIAEGIAAHRTALAGTAR